MMKKVKLFLLIVIMFPFAFLLSACGPTKYNIDFIVDNGIYYSINTAGKENITLPSDPEKQGYTFGGWFFDNGIWNNEVSIDSFKNENLSSNVKIYSKWIAIEYTAKFYADGNLISTSTFTVEDTCILNVPDIPPKQGCVGSWESYSISAHDLVINANYTPATYNVIYEENGGTNLLNDSYTYGVGLSSLPNSNDIVKEGYVFKYWKDENDNIITSIPNNKYGDITLFANWEVIEYTASFYADNILIANKIFTIEDNVITDIPNVPEKIGYDGIWESYVISAKNIKINAIYSVKMLTVIWNNYDGSFLLTTKVEYNKEPTYIGTTPVKETDEKYEYVFNDWLPTLTNITENSTYTATFTQRLCTVFAIKYDANGGIGAPDPQAKSQGQNIVLSSTIPIREDHHFVGWNNIYESKVYQSGDTFSSDLNVTLYAMWEDCCEHCHGDGTLQNQINCSNCSGTGKVSQQNWYNCSGCSGSGRLSYATVCSSCNGWGGDCLCECSCGNKWWANQTNSRICSRCGQSVKAKRYSTCSNCSGKGSVTAYISCPACNGSGGRYITYNIDCSQCNGTGKKAQTITCTYCNGEKIVKQSAPTYITLESRKVVLKELNGYEYSSNGTDWQDSNIFENLKPSTQYNFYQRIATSGKSPFGVTSSALTIMTKSSTLFYISYNLDGGINNSNNPTQYYTTNSNITLLSPTKEHYDFAGWKYNGNIVTEIKSSWAVDIELVATWTLHYYQITYELSGGSATNPNSYTIDTNSFTLNDATKQGYTFLGWTTSNMSTPQKNVVIEKGSNGNLIFTANWKANTYTLTFNTNGGSQIESITQECDSILQIPIPTLYGKSFVGWFDISLVNEINLEKMPTESMTVYAKWIDYNIQIISVDVKWMSINDDLTLNYLNASAIDTDGDNVNLTIDITSGTPKTKGDISFKLIATGLYETTVEKVCNIHILDVNESILYLYKNNEFINTLRIYKGENYSLPKESSSNVAWFYNEIKLTNDNGSSINAWDNDSGIYELKTNYYTISYDANNGIVNNNSQLVNLGASAILETPTRVGYQFSGWYHNNILYSDGIWQTADNITLTAKWNPNTDTAYTVNHYQQNIENDEYVLFETENLAGISDSTITPIVKSYSGFNSPTAQTTTISADGSKVINYYYTRVTYTLTIIKNNGTTTTKNIKYQANIEDNIIVTRDGFTFGGYFTDENLSQPITIMPCGNITVYTWWQEETKPIYLTYSGTSYITINGYTGTDARLQIPSYIGNKTVTTIAQSSIINNETLTEIVVPNSVTSIDEGAFKGCNKLTSITLPFVGGSKSVSTNVRSSSSDGKGSKYLFGYIFGSEILSSISGRSTNVPSNTTTLTYQGQNYYYDHDYNYTYQYYYWTRYYIPQTLRSVTITNATGISANAFYGCSYLTSITLNKEITAINQHAFYGCTGLTSIVIPENTTSIGNYAFYNNSSLSTLTFNEKVTTIGDYAFYGTVGLKNASFPSTLTSFGSYSFYNTRLETLTIPSKVTIIGTNAFQNDAKLTTLTIPSNVKTIGAYAFSSCVNIATLTLNSGINSIGNYAFENLAITTVTVPNSVTSIGEGAFKGCNKLTSITLPFVGSNNSVSTSVLASSSYGTGSQYLFGYIFGSENASSKSTTPTNVPSNTTTLTYQGQNYYYDHDYNYTYQYYYWTRYYIPQTLRSVTITNATGISANAFYGCSYLTSITLNKEITAINQHAFYGCTGLTSIVIPENTTSIGNYAFYGCTNLTINCKAEEQPTNWDSNWNPSNCPVVWGYGIEKGITEDGFNWISYDGKTAKIRGYEGSAINLVIPSKIGDITVVSIAQNTFSNNTVLKSIEIPSTITLIESYSIKNLANLEMVIIPIGVSTIQANAFYGCSKLSILCKSSSKPSGWSSSWNSYNYPVVWGYANETGITSDGLKWALQQGDSIIIYGYTGTNTIVTIPTTINDKSVTKISENAFRGKTLITSVYIPKNITFIGSYAFSGCTNLMINCEVASQPSGWSSTWKDSSTTVYWSM